MSRGRVLTALLVLLLAGGAVAGYLYLKGEPERLTEEYRERARPEHARVQRAMDDVYRTFNVRNLRQDFSRVRRADDPKEFLRAFRAASGQVRRRLARPARAVRRANRAIEGVSVKRLTDVPDEPLIGGEEEVRRMRSIARDERAYLRAARDFLRDYRRLTAYLVRVDGVNGGFARAIARGFASIPQNPGSPAEFTAPVDRMAERLERNRAAYGRLRPPRILREDKRLSQKAVTAFVEELRGLSDAVERLDLPAVQEFDNRLGRRLRQIDREASGTLRRLLTRSGYSRTISRLSGLDRKIRRKYAEL